MPESKKILGANNQLLRISFLIVAVIAIWLFPRDVLFDESRTFCIHKYLFGFECPLCGMTRAVYQLTHFQFVSAISFNAVVVLLPLYFIADVGSFFFGKSWPIQTRKIILILVFVGLLVLYLVRIASHFDWI